MFSTDDGNHCRFTFVQPAFGFPWLGNHNIRPTGAESLCHYMSAARVADHETHFITCKMQAQCYFDGMTKKRSAAKNQCPIAFALDLFGDRWSLLIIRDIVFKTKSHFREFLGSPEKISTNILAARLSKLEAGGVVTKSIDPNNASSFVYRLTDKGRDLVPLLLEMTSWSAKYDPKSVTSDTLIDGAPRHLLRRLKKDREALVTEILNSLPQ